MPFPKEVRDWWMRATGNGNAEEAQCQWRYFDDDGGVHQCTALGEQVHHPIPESYLLYHLAENPNGIEGLVVCLFHHIKGKLGIFEEQGSFHPDMGEAFRNYHQLKAQGRNSFAETAHKHYEKSLRGERFWTGNDTTDQFYREVAQDIAHRYSVEHPEDPMPQIKKHKHQIEPNRWYTIFFGDDDGNP